MATLKPDQTAQFRARGYVLSEDSDLALRDIARGLDALAQLCEDRSDDMPEIPPGNWGALLRTFSRQAQSIGEGAAWTNDAMARKRDG